MTKQVRFGTPEFMRLLKKWNKKLGPELNRIDQNLAVTGWTFAHQDKISYYAFGDVQAKSLYDTPGAIVVDAVREKASALPNGYPGRSAILEWAHGEANHGRDSIVSVAKRHRIPARTLNFRINKFLKANGLTNPWSMIRTGEQAKKEHAPVRRLSRKEIKAMERIAR